MTPGRAAGGSSPRLRGTRADSSGSRRTGRFIPAPAGNAVWPGWLRRGLAGSSPRLRGTRPAPRHSAARGRFIPAPAGNAWPDPGTSSQVSVHPRACGERQLIPDQLAAQVGSSPRLRGTLLATHTGSYQTRFIPAPAGNATAIASTARLTPVHPRACGERAPVVLAAGAMNGSSPRLRGTPTRHQPRQPECRFIPAPAGNAAYPTAARISEPVHPRACGERQLCP